MYSSAFKDALWGFCITAIAGTLLHFAYAASNDSALLAPFVPINESIWEHLKLLYWPTVFYTLFTFWRTGFDPHLLWARSCSLICGLSTTVILYYTYTGVIGRGFLWVDILLFYLAAAFTYGLSFLLCTRFPTPIGREVLIFSAMILLTGLCMFLWTWHPPQIQLFRDPQINSIAPVSQK